MRLSARARWSKTEKRTLFCRGETFLESNLYAGPGRGRSSRRPKPRNASPKVTNNVSQVSSKDWALADVRSRVLSVHKRGWLQQYVK